MPDESLQPPPKDAPAARVPGKSPAPYDPDAVAEDDPKDDTDDDEEAWTSTFGAEVGLDSRIVWRGLSETRGAVLHPEAFVGFYGVTLSAWGGFVLNTERELHALHPAAADISLDYTFRLSKHLRFEPAVTYFYSPERFDSGSTVEVALNMSYSLGNFRLINGNNVDIKVRPGAYFGTLGATYERAAGPTWTLNAFADIGLANSVYNDEYFDRNVLAINVLQAGISARYHISTLFYIAFHTEASTLIAPTLRDSVREPTLLTGGIAFGFDYITGDRSQ